MMRRVSFAAALSVSAFLMGMTQALAASAPQAEGARGSGESAGLIDVTARRKWSAAGRSLDYVVEAREIGVGEDAQGAPTGTIFSFTYLRADVTTPRARPVVFFFNGGPGAASALLHLSGLGPKRVPNTPRGQLAVDGVEDSRFSLLDIADLVFVDPVGTGFSRLLPGGKPDDYYGIDGDARTLAEFIRRWLDRHQRWTSPKFIVGESYGSFRAPLVADALTGGLDLGRWRGIQLDGLILIGTVLDLTQLSENPGNDLPFVLRFPTMAAIARHYGKAGASESETAFVQRARDFATGIYLPALNRGDTLTAQERTALAKQIGELSGLSAEFVLRHNLRIGSGEFVHELLADRGLIVGSYDARETLPAGTSKGVSSVVDPGSAARGAQLSAVLNDYMRRDLGIDTQRAYDEVNYSLNAQWRWTGKIAGAYWNSAPVLTDLMAQNPKMRVFVACGYYDLTTPFFGAERSLAHVGLPADRVRFRYYPSGHAAYAGDEALKQVSDDIRSVLLDSPTP